MRIELHHGLKSFNPSTQCVANKPLPPVAGQLDCPVSWQFKKCQLIPTIHEEPLQELHFTGSSTPLCRHDRTSPTFWLVTFDMWPPSTSATTSRVKACLGWYLNAFNSKPILSKFRSAFSVCFHFLQPQQRGFLIIFIIFGLVLYRKTSLITVQHLRLQLKYILCTSLNCLLRFTNL